MTLNLFTRENRFILGNSERISQNNLKVATGRGPVAARSTTPNQGGGAKWKTWENIRLQRRAELGGPVRRDFVRFFGVLVGVDEEIRVAISPTRCVFPRAPRARACTFYLENFINNSVSFQSVQFSSVQLNSGSHF